MLSLIELEKQYGRINPSFLGFECKMNEFYKVSFSEIMKKVSIFLVNYSKHNRQNMF